MLDVIDFYEEADKINKIKVRVKLEDKNNLDIINPLRFDFCWIDHIPKEILLNQLDKIYDQMKQKISELLYGE